MSTSKDRISEVFSDLRRIHAVVTRALEVAIANSQTFASRNHPESADMKGFAMYVRCLSSMLRSHHLTEDELTFPYFQKLLPDAPFDTLTAQHKEMIPYLENIQKWLEKMQTTPASSDDFSDLHKTLSHIQTIWLPHIQIEETHLSEDKAGALIGMEERIRLGKLYADHSRKHQDAGLVMIPFILYNLEPKDRAVIARSIPWIVTKILVPFVLKPAWKPMLPYLL